MNIRWSVNISYIDVTDKRLTTSYTLNAKDKDSAELLARELFIMEYGVHDNVDIIIEPEHLSSDDMKTILIVKDDIFKMLNEAFRNKSYKDFALSFQQYDGFSAYLSCLGSSYFWFNFRGLIIKAVYSSDGDCYLDTKEFYYETDKGKKILVRNSWTEYYYCV